MLYEEEPRFQEPPLSKTGHPLRFAPRYPPWRESLRWLGPLFDEAYMREQVQSLRFVERTDGFLSGSCEKDNLTKSYCEAKRRQDLIDLQNLAHQLVFNVKSASSGKSIAMSRPGSTPKEPAPPKQLAARASARRCRHCSL